MRVLVTGGAGFIGSHVVEALAAGGRHEVVVLDALTEEVHPSGRWPAELTSVPTVRGDVRDPDALDDVLRGVDVVCHQAAKVGLGQSVQDLPAYADHNVTGTAHLLAAMARAGTGRLVVASSMVVYGEGRYRCADHGLVRPGPRQVEALEAGVFDPPCPRCGASLGWEAVPEFAPADPRNAYATSKLAQEHLTTGWVRETDGRAVVLRYHNVYGPRMPRDTPYAGVASIFRSALAAGQAPRVFEDGGQQRDFVHVTDVAAANVAAVESLAAQGSPVETYNVGSGEPHTVGEMAVALAGPDGPVPVVTGEYRLGDVRHVVADSTRMRERLGVRPQTSFTAGMREFAAAVLR